MVRSMNDHELMIEIAMRLYIANIKTLGTHEGMKKTAKMCWAAADAFLEAISEEMDKEQEKE
jgi:hypothetical protein